MHCILCAVQLKGIEKQGHCVHFVRIVLPGKGIVLQRKGIVCAFSKSSSARWSLLLEPRAVAATILNWMMVKMMMMTIMRSSAKISSFMMMDVDMLDQAYPGEELGQDQQLHDDGCGHA